MYRETFAEKIKTARKKKLYTQAEAAEELKIPRSTLANYEAGRTEPDIETLAKLIDFYEEEAHYILGTRK